MAGHKPSDVNIKNRNENKQFNTAREKNNTSEIQVYIPYVFYVIICLA